MNIASCPAADELTDFNLGKLPEERLQAVAEHLAACATCQTTLQALEAQADTLVSGLRQGAPAEAYAEEPAFREAVEKAKALTAQGLTEALGPPRPRAEAADERRPGPGQLREYRLLEKLGEGGMGTLYKALHTRLKRVVALKVLPSGRMNDPAAVARFQREMEAVGRLNHPHIVRATDAGEVDGTHFLVMEFIAGQTLAQLVEARGPLPVAEACELIRQAALGLQHVHEHGLVHRDVKPSNLLLSVEGQVKVLDLGLALLKEEGPAVEGLTATGQVMGTFDYMAPEQFGDTHAVDSRGDIYALGCTLYFLLTGTALFGGPAYPNRLSKMLAHAQAPVPPIRDLRGDVPAGLAAVLARMLAKHPADRFATAAEVAAALAPFAAGCNLDRLAETTAVRSAVPSPGPYAQPGTDAYLSADRTGTAPLAAPVVQLRGARRRWLAVTFAAGIVLVLAAGALMLLRIASPGDQPLAKGPPFGPQAPGKDGGDHAKKKEFDKHAAGGLQIAPLDLKPEPLRLAVGDPISRFALVPRPAHIKGLRSWTVETRYPRGQPNWQLMALNRGGSRLATLNGDGTLRIWDVTAKQLAQAVPVGQRGIAPHFLGWSPDGTTLATLLEGRARLWDARTGRLLKTFGDRSSVMALAWAPNGSRMALADGKQHRVVLWEPRTDRVSPTSLPVQSGWAPLLGWSPDGGELACAHRSDGRVDQLDVASNRITRTLRRKRPEELIGNVGPLAWSPDGKWLACPGGTRTAVWNLAGGDHAWDIPGVTDRCRWAGAGKTLVGYQWDQQVFVWDVVAGKSLPLDRGRSGPRCWTPDGKLFAYYSGTRQHQEPFSMRLSRDDSMPSFSWGDQGAASAVWELPEMVMLGVRNVAWSPDKKCLAISADRGGVFLAKGEATQPLAWFADGFLLDGLPPDDTHITLGGPGGEIDVRATDSRKVTRSFRPPDGLGNRLVSRSRDGSVPDLRPVGQGENRPLQRAHRQDGMGHPGGCPAGRKRDRVAGRPRPAALARSA
jgi:WD40 repeat protein/anti-sigma factor RsiW